MDSVLGKENDKPFKCLGNSKGVKKISKTYTNTVNLLRQFPTAKKLPKNFILLKQSC